MTPEATPMTAPATTSLIKCTPRSTRIAARAAPRTIRIEPNMALVGIMTMAPVCATAEEYRPYFRETASLFRRLSEGGMLEGEPVLSMGMSESFETAIEEGATLVRVGRALFRK